VFSYWPTAKQVAADGQLTSFSAELMPAALDGNGGVAADEERDESVRMIAVFWPAESS
jgi:hypothetical protein